MPDWLKQAQFFIQKGFGFAVGLIGLKLLLADAKLDTNQGLFVATLGAILLSVAAAIEYLVWRDTTYVLDKKAQKSLGDLAKHLADGRSITFKDHD